MNVFTTPSDSEREENGTVPSFSPMSLCYKQAGGHRTCLFIGHPYRNSKKRSFWGKGRYQQQKCLTETTHARRAGIRLQESPLIPKGLGKMQWSSAKHLHGILRSETWWGLRMHLTQDTAKDCNCKDRMCCKFWNLSRYVNIGLTAAAILKTSKNVKNLDVFDIFCSVW